MGCFSKGGSDTQTVSSLSPSQQDVSRVLGPLISRMISGGQGASAYGGQLTAPFSPAINDAFSKVMGSNAFDAAYSGMANLAKESDLSNVAKRWESTFATPVMETWRKTVAPIIEQQFAGVPGAFYSGDRATTMRNEANRFFSDNVASTLFSSQESALQRTPKLLSAMAMLPAAEWETKAGAGGTMQAMQQAPLSAQYQEFMRTAPENSPWLQMGLNYLGIPMTNTVVQQNPAGLGYQMLPSMIGMGMGALGGLSGMFAGGGGGTQSALTGGRMNHAQIDSTLNQLFR